MKKGTAPPRPLIAAAEKLDGSLAQHGRATRELLRLSLDNRRDMGRAEEVLSRLARHEQELAVDMQGFVTALHEASAIQQSDAQEAKSRALEFVQRRGELEALDNRMRLLAEAVKQVRNLLEALKEGGGAGVADVLGQLTALANLAKGVSEDARTARFEDVATEAHALRQQLESVLHRAEDLERKMPRA